MGFRQANNEKRGGFARIWTIEDKGKYSVVKLSTSKKIKDTEDYETDFQDGFVRLVGAAHEKGKLLNVGDKGVSIQITSCDVTTTYNAEQKKGYTNFVIFDFDIPESYGSRSTAKTSTAKKSKPVDEVVEGFNEDDLPF